MANDFGTAKSVFILAIVVGCFAILWPNVFYPMITGDYEQKTESLSSGCCDVIFDNDINGIKIMTQLCENILNGEKADNKTIISFTQGKLSKDTIELCKKTVFEKCSIDISELLSRNAALGKDYKQTLDLLRTLNSSICIRESFGISLGQVGLPRRMRIWGLNISKHMKPERPSHLHPEMMHPALREKGRAIQQSQKLPPEARPGAIPGMRPTLGGAGHVVPPPKGGGTMGIVMPMYTIGIVIFFLYTMLKLMFKKSGDGRTYDDFTSDADFERDVFGLNQDYIKDKGANDSTRLGWQERDARDVELEMLKERLQETERAMERIVAKMMSLPNHSSPKESSNVTNEKPVEVCEDIPARSDEKGVDGKIESDANHEIDKGITDASENTTEENVETKTSVKVVGMETTESCERGKWSRPETPRPPTPQNIYIPAVLPDQSKIIVTNSSTETISSSEDDAAVVLSGKVTLSLIGIHDPDNGSNAETTVTDKPVCDVGDAKRGLDLSSDSLTEIDKITESKLNASQDTSLATNG